MVLNHVTSYPVAVAREEARLVATDLAAAVFGRRWKRDAPVLLVHHLEAGTLPGAMARVCDMATVRHIPAVAELAEEWVTGAQAGRARAVARAKREEAAASAPENAPKSAPKRAAKTRARTRRATPAELARARQILLANPGMLRKDVAAQANVSPRTVDRLKSELPRAAVAGEVGG